MHHDRLTRDETGAADIAADLDPAAREDGEIGSDVAPDGHASGMGDAAEDVIQVPPDRENVWAIRCPG
jgi:hypothetical protein